MAVGSRYVPGGRIVGWKWHRRLISRGANLLASSVLGLGVKDVTSGFRAYKGRVFKEIVSKSKLNGFDFQVEALHIAKRLGLKIVEIPIAFTNRRAGKSKLNPKDVFNYTKSVFKMHASAL